MNLLVKIYEASLVFVTLGYMDECTNLFSRIDGNYHLVNEAYSVAKSLFNQGKANYMALKDKSLKSIDTFLDLVYIMNNEMAKELRSAVLKFYKIRYFNDFTNYMITMEEIKDIVEHCLIDPVEKLEQIRTQFKDVMKNFEDIRNFDTVDKCYKELPDEVATAHCILHQGVLFNETMQESLVIIVEMKTKQYVQDMNQSLYNVQKCFNDFVPNFFEQLLLDTYTSKCSYLRVVNASIADLMMDKWRSNETLFPEKWSPAVKMLKEKSILPTLINKKNLIESIFSENITNSIELFNASQGKKTNS